jgi:hypothetical protein
MWLAGDLHVALQNEFTSLILPLLSRKIRRTMPALLPHPPLLAHTIYEALAFDAALIEEGFTLYGTSATKDAAEWDGISEIILGKREWFEAWMEGEKTCEFRTCSVFTKVLTVLFL